jgi:hypothetical protein
MYDESPTRRSRPAWVRTKSGTNEAMARIQSGDGARQEGGDGPRRARAGPEGYSGAGPMTTEPFWPPRPSELLIA